MNEILYFYVCGLFIIVGMADLIALLLLRDIKKPNTIDYSVFYLAMVIINVPSLCYIYKLMINLKLISF